MLLKAYQWLPVTLNFTHICPHLPVFLTLYCLLQAVEGLPVAARHPQLHGDRFCKRRCDAGHQHPLHLEHGAQPEPRQLARLLLGAARLVRCGLLHTGGGSPPDWSGVHAYKQG